MIELLDGIVDAGRLSRPTARWQLSPSCSTGRPTAALSKRTRACGVKAPAAETSRDECLSDDELRLLWRGCVSIGWPFGPFVQLLLLTAQRRDEVAKMRRSELREGGTLWTIPAERAKNGQAHDVPLSAKVQAYLH